jgi:hypothetical protein
VANPRDQFEPNEKRSVAVKTQGAVESFDGSKFPDLRFMEPMTGIEPAYSAWEVFRRDSTLFAR